MPARAAQDRVTWRSVEAGLDPVERGVDRKDRARGFSDTRGDEPRADRVRPQLGRPIGRREVVVLRRTGSSARSAATSSAPEISTAMPSAAIGSAHARARAMRRRPSSRPTSTPANTQNTGSISTTGEEELLLDEVRDDCDGDPDDPRRAAPCPPRGRNEQDGERQIRGCRDDARTHPDVEDTVVRAIGCYVAPVSLLVLRVDRARERDAIPLGTHADDGMVGRDLRRDLPLIDPSTRGPARGIEDARRPCAERRQHGQQDGDGDDAHRDARTRPQRRRSPATRRAVSRPRVRPTRHAPAHPRGRTRRARHQRLRPSAIGATRRDRMPVRSREGRASNRPPRGTRVARTDRPAGRPANSMSTGARPSHSTSA